jgi:membrane peptidoglycan carboxypeptidase
MRKRKNFVIPTTAILCGVSFLGIGTLFAIDDQLSKTLRLPSYSGNLSGAAMHSQVSESGPYSPINLKRVSPYMIQALLAAEDHNFYQHDGIDAPALLRASLDNLKAGHMIEGGSTITQQLAKNVFLDWRDRTALRKLKQCLFAWELEKHYSKDEILESYLNCVYFGNGAYGVERAAKTYFGVHASQLTLAQSAFLAALLKAPSDYGLSSNQAAAFARQASILQNMVRHGHITEEQARSAQAHKLIVIPYEKNR